MRRFVVVLSIVVLALFILVPVASAHNAGHIDTAAGCVDVGGGNHPPEGNAFGTASHARGVHHAAHAGPEDKSAVRGGFCT